MVGMMMDKIRSFLMQLMDSKANKRICILKKNLNCDIYTKGKPFFEGFPIMLEFI